MPDNLRITTPIPTGDTLGKLNPAVEGSNVDAVNPSRVGPPNTHDQNVSDQQLDLLLSRESVFNKFIEQLRQLPGLSGTLEKIVFDLSGRRDSLSTLPKDSLIRLLSESIAAGKEDMLESLQFQQKDSTRFSGDLFRLLNQLSLQKADPQFDLRLAAFLKAFDGYQSSGHTLEAILANLETIERQIPLPYARKLQAAAGKLNPVPGESDSQSGEGKTAEKTGAGAEASSPGGRASLTAQSAEQDLEVLKKEIIPLLSDYVSQTNDYGKARETISLFLHNVAMLNVSSKENLETQFGRLITYCRHSLNLSAPDLHRLEQLCAREFSQDAPKGESGFFKALLPFLSQGYRQDVAGFEKTVYQDIIHSLLLDNSVYMPFVHLYMPAIWQGRNLFAQMWIEKKNEEHGKTPKGEVQRQPSQIYLTFDIQDLGYFEAVLSLLDNRADLRLSCPPSLARKSGEIVPELSQIFRKNGFTAGKIQVSSSDKPQVPNLILSKIYERKRSVDVTV